MYTLGLLNLTDHKSLRHNTISSCELDLSCHGPGTQTGKAVYHCKQVDT